jgi:hypothetical protein
MFSLKMKLFLTRNPALMLLFLYLSEVKFTSWKLKVKSFGAMKKE